MEKKIETVSPIMKFDRVSTHFNHNNSLIQELEFSVLDKRDNEYTKFTFKVIDIQIEDVWDLDFEDRGAGDEADIVCSVMLSTRNIDYFTIVKNTTEEEFETMTDIFCESVHGNIEPLCDIGKVFITEVDVCFDFQDFNDNYSKM